MRLPMYVVDAFTDKPFAGNPAAVCLLGHKDRLSDATMQKIAAEMNLSETAFVSLLDDQSSFETSSTFGLRWFTPQAEVALCGHATVASAAVLFKCIGSSAAKFQFKTLSGLVSADILGELINIYFPENKPVAKPQDEVQGIIDVVFSGTAFQPVDIQYCPKTTNLLFRMPDSLTRVEFESFTFDVDKLLSVVPKGAWMQGVILTLKGSVENGGVDAFGRKYDFMSRYFAPWVGVKEDPVTGSTQTVLAPYWSQFLDKTTFYARQCSARGGDLSLALLEGGRVQISGPFRIVLKGTIDID